MSGHHRSQLLPPLCRCLQAAEASPEEGGLGSRYAFRQRFYSTLPPTLDNELRVRCPAVGCAVSYPLDVHLPLRLAVSKASPTTQDNCFCL